MGIAIPIRDARDFGSWTTKIINVQSSSTNLSVNTATFTLVTFPYAVFDEAGGFSIGYPNYIVAPSWATHVRVTGHLDWKSENPAGETSGVMRVHLFRNADLNSTATGPTFECFYHALCEGVAGVVAAPNWQSGFFTATDRVPIMEDAETWSLFAYHNMTDPRLVVLGPATWLSAEFFALPQTLVAEGDSTFTGTSLLTINCAAVTATSIIRCTHTSRTGASSNWYEPVGTRVPGTSFTVRTGAADTNTFHWKVFRPDFLRS